jgi:hypothetical protein
VVLRRRKSFLRAPVHQTPHPLPRTRVGRAAPPGGRRRASRRLYSVRTPRGWLGPARGEFPAPNSPLVPPPVLLADFWATGRARNPLDFVRLVVPIKTRGRYTLFSAIRRAEGVRRVRNGDFWKSELLAKDALTEHPIHPPFLLSTRLRVAAGAATKPHCYTLLVLPHPRAHPPVASYAHIMLPCIHQCHQMSSKEHMQLGWVVL